MLRHSISNCVEKIVINHANYKLFFDGCSKGNPGLAGAGAVIYNRDEEIWCKTYFIGEKITNNHAEYSGLILGLQNAVELNIRSLLVMGDSQLVINHMTGKYKCKSPNLISLYETAKNLEKNFDTIEYKHILRNLNKRADELSNLGLNEYLNSSNK
jgi:ribonuclease HI